MKIVGYEKGEFPKICKWNLRVEENTITDQNIEGAH